MSRERRRYLYRGHVQGVGFRATARRIARDLSVVGFVRNLPDGRVELVAEGEPRELDALAGAIAEAFGAMIHGVDQEQEPIGGEPLEGFTIRF